MTQVHRPLPHERRFASFILERQRTHRTPTIIRLEQNYGPEGITLMAAAILSGVAGALIVWVGIVFLFQSGDHGPLLHSGYYVMFTGMGLECPGIIRATQALYVGRAFAVVGHS